MSLSVAVLGLGLMGGSVALAAKTKGVARSVAGWDPSAKACATALARGLVDRIEVDPEDAVAGADIVVLACPVIQVPEIAIQVGPSCGPGTVVTDLGSTKASIMRGIGPVLAGGATFVGGHPIAGSEKSGCAHSEGGLFEGKLTVVCPGLASEDSIRRIEQFWQSLGSRTIRMDSEEHDRALAATSHLPHLLAFILAGLPAEKDKAFAGGGFRDTTRIAASDPDLWAGILLDNRSAMMPLIDLIIMKLEQARGVLSDNSKDAAQKLSSILALGHRFRTGLDEARDSRQ